MSVEKKTCEKCMSFEKLKLFDDLNAKFHNWCNAVQKPIGLLRKCQLQEKLSKVDNKEYVNYFFQYY